jgi:transcriptional regulator GlxA family with amidase domain
VHEQPGADGSSLEPLLRCLEENVHRDLTLDDIAIRAKPSTCMLNRRFREQTGATPLRWLRRARIRRAQYLLEITSHPISGSHARSASALRRASATSSSDWLDQPAGLSEGVTELELKHQVKR